MEKNSVLGELLYIGLVCEKGRAKSSGIWGYSYKKSVKRHVEILKKITKCMQDEFNVENDNAFLRRVCLEINCDKTLRRCYPLKEMLSELVSGQNIITTWKEENKHVEIICLIDKMLEDILMELKKKVGKDKERISNLMHALHNLPRVYLNTEDVLRPPHEKFGIDSETAMKYCKLGMDENMLKTYFS